MEQVHGLPQCELNDSVIAELITALEAVSDMDVLTFNEDTEFMDLPDLTLMDNVYGAGSEKEALASLLRDNILDACQQVLEEGAGPQDVRSIQYPGLRFKVLATSKMFVHGQPSDSAKNLVNISEMRVLWDCLQKCAEEQQTCL
jgi:hypothetical protein